MTFPCSPVTSTVSVPATYERLSRASGTGVRHRRVPDGSAYPVTVRWLSTMMVSGAIANVLLAYGRFVTGTSPGRGGADPDRARPATRIASTSQGRRLRRGGAGTTGSDRSSPSSMWLAGADTLEGYRRETPDEGPVSWMGASGTCGTTESGRRESNPHR